MIDGVNDGTVVVTGDVTVEGTVEEDNDGTDDGVTETTVDGDNDGVFEGVRTPKGIIDFVFGVFLNLTFIVGSVLDLVVENEKDGVIEITFFDTILTLEPNTDAISPNGSNGKSTA